MPLPPTRVLATYSDRAGSDVFALCRSGLLIFGSASKDRFIAYKQVEAVDFADGVKTSMKRRMLLLTLAGGDHVVLPVDGERGKFLDVFPVHRFLRRRAPQARRDAGLPGVP